MKTRWMFCLDRALCRGAVDCPRASHHVHDRQLLRSWCILPIPSLDCPPVPSPDRPQSHVDLRRRRRFRYKSGLIWRIVQRI